MTEESTETHENTETITVQPWQQNQRLDALLHQAFPTSSRTYFQGLIEEGLVLVNGKSVKKSFKAEMDDEIEVQFQLTKELEILPENIPLNILYEDEFLIAVNKPAHMVVHPAHGNWRGTFVNALLFYCKNLEKQDALRPGIVHRLDKETSGVLVATKTIEAHRALSAAFAARQVDKSYLALISGAPQAMTIRAPLGRHPVYRKQMAVVAIGGKEAITHIEPVQAKGKVSLVRVNLETGRTHQIRVHLKHIGCPILGDSLYGVETLNKLYKARRQMLHAASIAFLHPVTGKFVRIEAPLPEDMQSRLESLL